MAQSIPVMIHFFQGSFATSYFLAFICAVNYSHLNVSYTKKKTHPD